MPNVGILSTVLRTLLEGVWTGLRPVEKAWHRFLWAAQTGQGVTHKG